MAYHQISRACLVCCFLLLLFLEPLLFLIAIYYVCHNIKKKFDVSTFFKKKFLIFFIINDFGFNYILYYINILLEKKMFGRRSNYWSIVNTTNQLLLPKKMDVINMFC